MPRRSWLGLVVCVTFGATAFGQDLGTLPLAPPTPSPGAASPGILSHEPVLKDLTPPGFTDLIPPDPHSNGQHGHPGIPGNLSPFVPEHSAFYVGAEFLLFRARSDNFDYAVLNGTRGLATTGPIESLKYDVDPGFRVDLGYVFGGGWDAAFSYTYFQSGGDRAILAPPGEVFFPTYTRPGLTDTVTAATVSADLVYNLYDIQVGKRLAFGEHFGVRAFGGFRFADISQQFNALYNGLDARQAAVNSKSRFEGFGPIIGGEAVLVGWRGFHAYARSSGGLITGRSVTGLNETNDAGNTVYVDTRYAVRKVVPVASIGIGGGWQYRTVTIRAGYEITQWLGLTERPRFTDDISQGAFVTRPGNLSLEGLFIQVNLTF